ncbi:MAG: hypothetical protein AAGG48_11155 [Planctomycetota bacterium]
MRTNFESVRQSYERIGSRRLTLHASRFLGIVVFLMATNVVAGDDELSESVASDSAENKAPSPWIEDGWEMVRDDKAGIRIRTRPLRLRLRDEPSPALSYQFIPLRKVEGNAAIYYLKAMGFLEQQAAQAAVAKLQKKWFDEAQDAGEAEFKPYVWLSSDPSKINLEEAREYLMMHSFQPRELRQAVVRRSFDLDRRIEEVDDPISYLLPEIQTMRQLARVQSLRTRVALAEDRIDDAIECLQQQFALAAHLGDEPFLVSNLVGIAIARIACNDVLYLMQRDNAPNLYWAIASMPDPLVDTSRAVEYERGMLYQQLKMLKQVDEQPRSPAYWNDFLDAIAPQFGYFAKELGISSDPDDNESVRQGLVGYVIAAYPGAKRFLMEQMNMTAEQLDEYPPTQVVMLATVRYYDISRDDLFKYFHLPFWQATESSRDSIQKRVERDAKRYGTITKFTESLLPVVTAVQGAKARSAQLIAALQTIEAIRIYATRNDGRLPASLDELPLPARMDPATGKLPRYQVDGESALLTWGAFSGLQDRYRLSIAQPEAE